MDGLPGLRDKGHLEEIWNRSKEESVIVQRADHEDDTTRSILA